MIGNFIGVVFDGIAYGSLLFVISIGLSVTMGLMNFVNLAHGAFAMVGGYACVLLMTRLGVPFLATLPIAFVVAAAVGMVLERTLYRRLYQATHLDQVLFSIGLVFMAIAATTYLLRATAAAGAAAAFPARTGARVRARPRRVPVVPDRRGHRDHHRADLADRAHALRRRNPRLGRQSAGVCRSRNQRLSACSA